MKITRENLEIANELKKYGALFSVPHSIRASYDVYVMHENSLYHLEELSPVVKSIKESEENKRSIIISSPEDKIKEIEEKLKQLSKK